MNGNENEKKDSELDKSLPPLTDAEKEAALDRATLADREQLAAKQEEMAKALSDVTDPGLLSDHVRNELGIENRPVEVSEEVKEVKEEMADSKRELTGKKESKDTLKNPAEKAMNNPSKNDQSKSGPMFGKRSKRKGK